MDKKIKVNINRKGVLISLSVVVITVIIDFVSKLLVMHNMDLGESIPIIENVLHITYITNKGAAFGSFADSRWIFMTVSTVMLIGLTALIIVWPDRKNLFYISVPMIMGGGIGNMIDRTFYGEVVDFIDFQAFPDLWMWIFNFADSFVCVGTALLLVYYITLEVRSAKKKKAEEQAENQEEE